MGTGTISAQAEPKFVHIGVDYARVPGRNGVPRTNQTLNGPIRVVLLEQAVPSE